MSATAGALRRTGRRHRVVAIGSGFGGLTAAKMLKHAEMNITDALVFLTRFFAQGIARFAHQMSYWHQAVPVIATATTTIAVLIALCIGVFRELTFRCAETQRIAVNSVPERTGSQWQMCAGADDILTVPRDAFCHMGLRPVAKGLV